MYITDIADIVIVQKKLKLLSPISLMTYKDKKSQISN